MFNIGCYKNTNFIDREVLYILTLRIIKAIKIL